MPTPKKRRITAADLEKRFNQMLDQARLDKDVAEHKLSQLHKKVNSQTRVLQIQEDTTTKLQEINDAEFRATGKHLAAIHQRLEDLEKGAHENEKVWRRTSHGMDTLKEDQMAMEGTLERFESAITEGDEIRDLQQRLKNIEFVTPIGGSGPTFSMLAEEIAAIRSLVQDPISHETHAVHETRIGHLEQGFTSLRRVHTERLDSMLELLRTEQNKRRALEHSNALRKAEIIELTKIVQTLGPLWKTSVGHTVPMALLSTAHLEQLQRGNWLGGDHEKRRFVRKELKRREEDLKWREVKSDTNLNSTTESDHARIRVLENNVGKLQLQRIGQVIVNGNNVTRLKNLESRVNQAEIDNYNNIPVEIDPSNVTIVPPLDDVEDLVEEVATLRRGVDELRSSYCNHTKRLDAHGKDINRFKPAAPKFTKTTYTDVHGVIRNVETGDIRGVRPKLPKPKKVYSTPSIDPDIHLDDGEDEDEDHSYMDENGDLILPLLFPKIGDDLSYTITRGKLSGKPFIHYGDVKMEERKRGFFARLLRWGR